MWVLEGGGGLHEGGGECTLEKVHEGGWLRERGGCTREGGCERGVAREGVSRGWGDC